MEFDGADSVVWSDALTAVGGVRKAADTHRRWPL